MLKKTMKLAVMVVVTALMTGCASINMEKNYDWQDKIWSAVIVKTLVDSSKHDGLGEKNNVRTNYDKVRDKGLRVTLVHFSSGFTSVMLNVVLPDNLEYSDIPKRSLVEVMVEENMQLDFSKARFPRVLRVICDIEDKECINREDKAKRIRVVLDANPDAANLNAVRGISYNRRQTAEEVKKYK